MDHAKTLLTMNNSNEVMTGFSVPSAHVGLVGDEGFEPPTNSV